jgi:hypothetical protein
VQHTPQHTTADQQASNRAHTTATAILVWRLRQPCLLFAA